MSIPEFIVAVPARFSASRLPGKPLRLLGGEPIIRHVVRRALTSGARQVVLATDDARIATAVDDLDVHVCMTRAEHLSGTDRLAECALQCGWGDETLVVNLQGDEPFAPVSALQAVVRCLAENRDPMATLAASITDTADLFDPNVVKVVVDAAGHALYFSRAPIPWQRERFASDRVSPPVAPCLRHIGLYAYRAGFLRIFQGLPVGALERIEALEQLRVLEAGHRIAVTLSSEAFPPGIDTEEDLARAELAISAA